MPRLDDPRVAAALAPLPDGAPDPATFRYDPEFEAVAGEIGKLERAGPAGVRWADVARDAQAILATRAKDLTVAAWLAVALGRTEGLGGLAAGLAILRGLVEQAWEQVFPVRPRARSGALEWLAANSAPAVPAALPDPSAGPAAVAAFEDIEALDRALADKLAEPPALGDLVRRLRALAEEQRQAEAAQAAHETAAAAPPPVAAVAAVSAGAPAAGPAAAALAAMPAIAGADAEALFGSMREAVRTAALEALQADAGEARAYRMLRAITWLQITDLPPARDGRTELMPPPEIRRVEFDALSKAGNLPDLVLALESYCSGSGLFWLDGQRLSAAALAAMGPRFAACGQAVVQGVQAMLRRLPGIEALSFSDGTPFADAATRGWIDGIVLGDAARATDDAAAGAALWEPALQAARSQVAQGETEAALQALAAGGAAAASLRDRFMWRLAQATLCLESGIGEVAVPLLRDLDRLVDAHGLESWEPAIAARAAQMLHRSLTGTTFGGEDAGLAPDDGRAALASAAFARLARTDPVAAARLAGGRNA
ncbi:MAG: type VI secretion system protein TssA [Proteobacteria bacterium]|nr:type VI secretion system protein TssA [Pseudomonadota bacterium]